MSHYAKVKNGKVNKVLIAEEEFFDTFIDETPGMWVKTSYNMKGGVYYNPETNAVGADQSIIVGDEARERKNYAQVGGWYDVVRNAFYSPQPYASWTLNETSFLWEAPTAYPDDGELYDWNEETTSWDAVQ